jgi:DNA-binding transcriptional ArsR family regulator
MMDDFAYSLHRDIPAAPVARPDHRASLLVMADRLGVDDLAPLADGADLRLLGVVPLSDAPARLDAQAHCDLVLLYCPVASPMLERLLVQVETHAIQNGTSVIIVAGSDTLDLAYACQRSPHSHLLCDPDGADLAATIVAAAGLRPPAGVVHEPDRDNATLQQLSEEVGRLARTIDALTRRARAAAPSLDSGQHMADRSGSFVGMPALAPIGGAMPSPVTAGAVTTSDVRDLLRARRIRADFLPGDLFADPAWDMLLDLLAARLEQERVSVSSLCIAAAVPPTTALRWIRTLTDKGLVERQADPQDGRRIFIGLAQHTAEALLRWFESSRRLLGN